MKKKRLLSMLLAATFLFSLTACATHGRRGEAL